MNKDHCNHHPQIKLMCKFELGATLLHVTLDHMVSGGLLSCCAECVHGLIFTASTSLIGCSFRKTDTSFFVLLTESKSIMDNTQSNELGPMT